MLTSKKIALISSFSALAIVLSLLPLYYPFPPIPFLKFDIAEVPLGILSIMTDPASSLLASIIVGIFITFREGDPIGAFFKLLALASTYVPLAFLRKKGKAIQISVPAIVRAIIMTLANYFLIPILYTPGHPTEELAALLGLSIVEFLLLVALFNMIQALLNIIPAIILYDRIPREWKSLFGAEE